MSSSSDQKSSRVDQPKFSAKAVWLTILIFLGLCFSLFYFKFTDANASFWSSEVDPKQEVPGIIVVQPAPEQPIAFSHKQHVQVLAFQCVLCHANADPGVEMGFPDVNTCKSCHMTVGKDENTLKRLKELANLDEQIPWTQVYEMPERPIWSHKDHLDSGLECIACHGDVSELDSMIETTAVTAMASCIACHESHNAGTRCDTCHAWPADPIHPSD